MSSFSDGAALCGGYCVEISNMLRAAAGMAEALSAVDIRPEGDWFTVGCPHDPNGNAYYGGGRHVGVIDPSGRARQMRQSIHVGRMAFIPCECDGTCRVPLPRPARKGR